MGKLLIIAEKPSVAADIAKALGGFARNDKWLESQDMLVSSAVGHLVEVYVPAAETTGRDLDSLPIIEPFELRALDRGADQFRLLKGLMARNDVDTIVNACDAGREGELIFRLIYEHAGCRKPTKRMWLQSMTQDAIREAFRQMRDGSDFDDLGAAARCRTEADWLVGINGSRGATRLRERQTATAASMNAGRVQTPSLMIVVDREIAIRTFVPKDYWEIHGTFKVAAGNYVGKWFDPRAKEKAKEAGKESEDPPERFWDRAQAEAIIAKCRGRNPTNVTEESKPSLQHAKDLYDLTSLQREANTRFGISAKKTLDIAQALYEKHKVTTYPRTDSRCLPEDYIPKAIGTLRDFAGTSYEKIAQKVVDEAWVKPNKKIFNDAKITDHFAIIPTGKKPEGLDSSESKVYDMIVKRFIAAFYPPAEYTATTRITEIDGEFFKSTGRVLVFEGWKIVYGKTQDDEKDKEPALTKYVPGEAVTAEKVDLKSLKTKSPVRFTEATLLGAMENAGKLVEDDELAEAMSERGLGTPATRAAIIEGLLANQDSRGNAKEPYLTREGKELVPTVKAFDLHTFLSENGIEALKSPKMTGEWEFKLRQMEQGAYSRADFMREIEELTRNILDIIKRQAANVKLPTTDTPCPSCNGTLSVGPRMLKCESGCGFEFWRSVAGRALSMAELEQLLTTKSVGPLDGFLSKTKKRFTASLTLNDEFKVEFSFDNTAITTDAAGNEVHCPKCQGSMRRIKGKTGFFWGCMDRDNCKTTLPDKDGFPADPPKTKPCGACGRPAYLRSNSRGAFWGCSGYKTGDCKHMEDAPGEKAPPPRAGSKPPAKKTAGGRAPAKKTAAGGRSGKAGGGSFL
jgi:DNA topoisomerase-3